MFNMLIFGTTFIQEYLILNSSNPIRTGQKFYVDETDKKLAPFFYNYNLEFQIDPFQHTWFTMFFISSSVL